MQRSQFLDMSLTVKDDAGQVVAEVSQEELVSFTPPLQPTIVNPGFYNKLEASAWRHQTHWYDREMDSIRDLRSEGLVRLADYLELLLYADFVVAAEMMGRQGLRNRSAYPQYCRVFKRFVKNHRRSPPLPGNYGEQVDLNCDEFLESIELGSYMVTRLACMNWSL